MTRILSLSAAVLVVGVLAPASAANAGPPGIEGVPRFEHVAIVVLENENESFTFGPGSPATYLNKTLVPMGTFDPNYYGTGHVSLDNYIAMTSGQPANPLTSSDCEANNFYSCVQAQQLMSGGQSIADQLEQAKLSWKEYADGTSTPCVHAAYDPTDPHPDPYQGDGKSPKPAGPDYADRHNPFVYYADIVGDGARCDAHVRPFTELASDIAADTVPSYAFITPDTCHDGHDAPCSNGQEGGLTSADRWLQENLPPLIRYLTTNDGLLLITLDEADPTSDFSGCCHGGPGGLPGFGGKVGILAIGDHVPEGKTITTSYDHASLLRTTEDAMGISTYLNNAASSSPMADLFRAKK